MAESTGQQSRSSLAAGEYLEKALAWSIEVRREVRYDLDVPYGTDDRQKLDVYLPENAGSAAPTRRGVLMFLHGGYWVSPGIQRLSGENQGEDAMEVSTRARLTCSGCGNAQEVDMPTDACQFLYECVNCNAVLKPKKGDCCVFCSYADTLCPMKQSEQAETAIIPLILWTAFVS